MKLFQLLSLVVVTLLLLVSPAAAQTVGAFSSKGLSAGLGAGLIIIGAAWGLGKIGTAALESMARQPEVLNKVQTAMIIIAALLEGATFFALLICLLLALGIGG